MNKTSMHTLTDLFFWMSTGSRDIHIIVYVRIDLDNLDLKIVKIVLILVWWYPRTALRFNKVTISKRFRCNLFKTNIKFEGTWWDSVGKVTWTIINWTNWIYNVTVKKMTKKYPNSFVMSCVSIRQFHSGLGWYKHRKVWHAIYDYNTRSSIFMKQHSRYSIIFLRSRDHQSSLKHTEVNIQMIFIIFWMGKFKEMIHFIIINLFNWSGVWIWN